MQVTHQQIVCGETTAGPLAILLSRFILWMRGDNVEAKLRRELNVRIEELREAYNLMHQARDEREALRERLVAMTRAIPGPWKVTKDGKKRYRRWEYPHARSMWGTESEELLTADEQWERETNL